MSPDLSRRRFASGLFAVAALPRLAVAQFLPTAWPSRESLRFGVFSLFFPQQLLVESAQPLLLHLDDQLVLVPPTVQPEALPITIRSSSHGRLQVTANRSTRMVAGIRITSMANETVSFTLIVPPPSLHGTIRRTYTGTLEIRQSTQALQPIISMDLESATASIVHAESPAHAPAAYLRAQAIVSRSFLLAAATGHRGFDFCDTTHCQFLREAPSPEAPAAIATRDTRPQSLTYDGITLAAMYSRSCGGHTRTLADLGLSIAGYPYYAVPCESCLRHPEQWSRPLGEVPRSDSFIPERDRLAHNRIHGWSALPSGSFIRTPGGIAGTGIGHGLGLCQRGAAAMAAQGSGHLELLAHYYPNTAMA